MSGEVELAIDAIAAGGDGVGRHEGLVVFVPRTAPGDVARVRLTSHGRFARGALVELVRPSADRVTPPCPHYVRDRCGGCQLQHLRYDAQRAAKARVVRDALQRIGGRAAEEPEVVPSAAEWRYRRKLTLALRRAGGRWVAGLHAFDDPRRVFELVDCPITDERVLAAWRELLAAADDLPRARELRVSVRLLDGGGAAAVVEGGDAWPTRAALFAAAPVLRELWWQRAGGARRLVDRRGADDREGAATGASFVQVNAAAAESLSRHVAARALTRSPASAVDAYAGTGDTAVRLAAAGVRVVALELDTDAAAACARRLPPGSRAIAGRVEDTLAGALPADVVVVNPPRGGLDPRVPALLESPGAGHAALIYVSCNPATLARDIARLPTHEVVAVRSFDMFPQTAHVETVCELARRAS